MALTTGIHPPKADIVLNKTFITSADRDAFIASISSSSYADYVIHKFDSDDSTEALMPSSDADGAPQIWSGPASFCVVALGTYK